MRFVITLERLHQGGNVLPINYQYELASWIYKSISGGDEAYAKWLHFNGFADGNKQFRLFTFSHLDIKEKKIYEDRIRLFSERINFQISLLPGRSTEEFIKGVFGSREFSLGDSRSKVYFRVTGIEKLPEIQYKEEMVFEALSPIVVSEKGENGSAHFLDPADEKVPYLLAGNLLQKYKAFTGKEFTGPDRMKFELLSRARKKGITIKTGTRSQTKVIGYLYTFRFTAPEELMKTGYHAGFGEKNSMGFGCVGGNE